MKTVILSFAVFFCLCSSAQPVQEGPYSVFVIADGVYHIEDANDSNPAGLHTDTDGKTTGMNNCSDMYLVVGRDKALLIDLSNFINWDTSAVRSLRSLVYQRAENKDVYITITHKHGDHLGMLPAFVNDPKVHFWIPEAEFKGMNLFPSDRTTYFPESASFDLGGGFTINSLEVPGHTEHSTVYFLQDKNLVFTGDAIGSGSGVWLFDYESFVTYTKSIDKLILYIQDPANHIDQAKLVIYGGHYWQKGKQDKLTAQYIYDMKTLIGEMRSGTAHAEPVSYSMRFLDTNFSFGTATITWNKKAEARYALNFSNP